MDLFQEYKFLIHEHHLRKHLLFYKSLNYQWWTPKKSDFEIVTKLDTSIKQEVKNEIWDGLQVEIQYFKDLYRLHKNNKKENKND